MPREDNVQLPPLFYELAAARSMGAQVRTMQAGSRLQLARDKVLAIGIFEQGSVIGFRTDQQPFHFRYDEVAEFNQFVVRKYVNGGYRGTDVTCWFKLNDGRAYRVGGETTPKVRHIVDDLREFADRPIATAQLPRMQAALRQGQSIDFRGYIMEPGGLHLPSRFGKGKRLAWADIQEARLKAGAVQVMARGKRWPWASVGVERVPNLTAFMTLVHAATSV